MTTVRSSALAPVYQKRKGRHQRFTDRKGNTMSLLLSQLDRAAGVLVFQAAGDALGAHYEGQPANPALQPQMLGGGYGPYEPGEWTDDTQMSICIGQVARTGARLDSPEALDKVAAGFQQWLDFGASDVGIGTHKVIADSRRNGGTPSEAMLTAAIKVAAGGTSAGNGALMRTGIVGLTRVESRVATAKAAAAVASLTHADLLCVESCILWSEAVRVAVMHGRLDLASGMDLLPDWERRKFWTNAIRVAEHRGKQAEFAHNGYTVSALQAAWHAIKTTERAATDGSSHITAALTKAVQLGNDTDTVAAIAGALLGARYGVAGVTSPWVEPLHGWPGMVAADLAIMGRETATWGEQ